MAIRLFRCADCGHKMRFGADVCGKCGFPAPDKNRPGLLFYSIAVVLIAGFAFSLLA